MPRFRNTTGGVLISLDFGLIGPGEYVSEHYDPEEHGVIPGCTQVDDEADGDTADTTPDDDSGSGTPPDPLPRRRGKAAGQDKETGE